MMLESREAASHRQTRCHYTRSTKRGSSPLWIFLGNGNENVVIVTSSSCVARCMHTSQGDTRATIHQKPGSKLEVFAVLLGDDLGLLLLQRGLLCRSAGLGRQFLHQLVTFATGVDLTRCTHLNLRVEGLVRKAAGGHQGLELAHARNHLHVEAPAEHKCERQCMLARDRI